jgi:hypothetical protein
MTTPEKELSEKLALYNSKLPDERIYVQTDKPFYKPGETIWCQVWLRDAADFMPCSSSDICYIELIDPRGSSVQTLRLAVINGSAGADIQIAADAAGGIYTLKAYTKAMQHQPNPCVFEKEIIVQKVVLPRLKFKLDFIQKGYGPGQIAEANLTIESSANQPLANITINYQLRLSGKLIHTFEVSTDTAGKALLRIPLPADLDTPDGLVNVFVSYEGQTESISRSIPITLNKIAIEFYPEGGDWITGIESQIGFQAVNHIGKPTDISGYIIDNEGNKVTTFASFHRGMGKFALKPQADKTYQAVIQTPEGISTHFDLPAALPRGYCLSVSKQTKETVEFQVSSTESDTLFIAVMQRSKLYGVYPVTANSNISINITNLNIGIAVFTLFDSRQIARAERLVFVNAHKKGSIELKTNKERYQPREKVELTLQITDNRGLPLPGQCSISIADDRLLAFADDKQGNLFAKLLLEQDLNGKIEEPNFYFDPEEPKAPEALDLLMRTRGWRRFKWHDVLHKPIKELPFIPEKCVGTVSGQLAGVFNASEYESWKAGDPEERKNLMIRPLADIKIKVLEPQTQQLIAETKTDHAGRFELSGIITPVTLSVDPETIPLAKIKLGTGNLLESLRNFFTLMPTAVAFDSNSLYIESPTQSIEWLVWPAYRRRVRSRPGQFLRAKGEFNPHEEEVAGGEMAFDRELLRGQADHLVPVMAMAVEMPRSLNSLNTDTPAEEIVAANPDTIKSDSDENIDTAIHTNILPTPTVDLTLVPDFPSPGAPPAMPIYYRARQFPAIIYAPEDMHPEIRTDFRSTVFWQGQVDFDDKGKAVITFYNSDAVSSFRIISEGFGIDGTLVRGEKTYATQLPVSMEIKIPVAVAFDDLVRLPLTLKNTTDEAVTAKMTYFPPEGWQPITPLPGELTVPANSAVTNLLDFKIENKAPVSDCMVRLIAGGFEEGFSQTVKTVPRGFPVSYVRSGKKAADQMTVSIERVIEGSLTAEFQPVPNILTGFLDAISGMLREPYGCFEQTSSSNFPNIMILKLLKSGQFNDSQVFKRALDLLDTGYKRLITFECADGGFEWFGQSPGHEALTAMGILQFRQMQAVYNSVDAQMLKRTGQWLLDRKDGKGGFKRNTRALDSFGSAAAEITDSYIVYALTQAGEEQIETELAAVEKDAIFSNDPYRLALTTIALETVGEAHRASALRKLLLRTQASDGTWLGNLHSITYSQRDGLRTETTALALMALQGHVAWNVIAPALQYLYRQQSGYGTYGSTQATILALQAIAAFANTTPENQKVRIRINGKEIKSILIDSKANTAQKIEFGAFLTKGVHNISWQFITDDDSNVSENNFPAWSLRIQWNTPLPESNADCAVRLVTDLAAAQVAAGDTVRLRATLTNLTSLAQPMTVAIIGLPGGTTPQIWQLREMMEAKAFDFFEIRENNLILYWRGLAPAAVVVLDFDLKADIPGEYTAPAGCAYLYYSPTEKSWAAPEKLTIVA